MKKISIINGPNLNLLGRRQPEIYGSRSFEDYFQDLVEIFPQLELTYFQSNHEGSLIDKLHDVGFNHLGVIMNPGAYSHTSIALADAIASIETPVIEVHISNIKEREPFRSHSYLEPHCLISIVGKGLEGYKIAIDYLLEKS